jgi:Tol biopolymer transport system component
MAFESAAAAWSPDGTQLACYMITGDQWGSFAVDVARQRHGRLPIRESDAVEDWSPDGREFSVMAENAGRKFKHSKLGKLPLHQIYVISTDGSHRTMLTPETTQDASWSRFSPDSSRIAYNLRCYPDQEKPPVQSGVVRGRDGANPKEIIRFADLGDQKCLARPLGGPCWSPDGKSVVWRVIQEQRDGSAAAKNSRFELVFVALSDGAIKRIPLEAQEIRVWGEIDWR